MGYRLFSFLLFSSGFVQASPYRVVDGVEVPEPKRELRGTWFASVWNLDWPSAPGLDPDQQRAELLARISEADELGLNTIFLQVRSEGDALYSPGTPNEPVSYWLTGKNAGATLPKYSFSGPNGEKAGMKDPLEFAILEAQKRGIDVHAWINPFRARTNMSQRVPQGSHLAARIQGDSGKKSWTFRAATNSRDSAKKYLWFNPGVPEVRQHTVGIAQHLVTQYPGLAGIHIDDYFYPYPAGSQYLYTDSGTPGRPHSTADKKEWRRQNINAFVREFYQGITEKDPSKVVSISPFGIRKIGVPEGTTAGFEPEDMIATEVEQWLEDESVDYLIPQQYWDLDGEQSFVLLDEDWKQLVAQKHGRHVFSGIHSNYKNWTTGKSRSKEELAGQIDVSREHAEEMNVTPGQVYYSFRAGIVADEAKTKLISSANNSTALPPVSEWKIPPDSKVSEISRVDSRVDVSKVGDQDKLTIFLKPHTSKEAEDAKYWIVQVKIGDEWKIIEQTAGWVEELRLRMKTGLKPEYIAVQAVDRFNRVSEPYVMEYAALEEEQSGNALNAEAPAQTH